MANWFDFTVLAAGPEAELDLLQELLERDQSGGDFTSHGKLWHLEIGRRANGLKATFSHRTDPSPSWFDGLAAACSKLRIRVVWGDLGGWDRAGKTEYWGGKLRTERMIERASNQGGQKFLDYWLCPFGP